MLFPIVGALLYIVIGGNLHKSKVLKAIKQSEEKGNKYFIQDEKIKKEIESQNNGKINYLMNYLNFPVTKNNNINYYKLGELAYPEMLKELKNAKKFIFLEYFIIKNGTMWSEILKILEEKAKEGLDVRLIYDDMGCIAFLPTSYPKQMEEKGIKCIAFNKLNPFLGVIMNNRDHRKMMIIDGKTVFSGGMNLADEYINLEHPYGKWKDNGIKITGEAVWNFTIMFLNMLFVISNIFFLLLKFLNNCIFSPVFISRSSNLYLLYFSIKSSGLACLNLYILCLTSPTIKILLPLEMLLNIYS